MGNQKFGVQMGHLTDPQVIKKTHTKNFFVFNVLKYYTSNNISLKKVFLSGGKDVFEEYHCGIHIDYNIWWTNKQIKMYFLMEQQRHGDI